MRDHDDARSVSRNGGMGEGMHRAPTVRSNFTGGVSRFAGTNQGSDYGGSVPGSGSPATMPGTSTTDLARSDSTSHPRSLTGSSPGSIRSGAGGWINRITGLSNRTTLPPTYPGSPSLDMAGMGTFAGGRFGGGQMGALPPAEKAGVTGWEDGVGYGLNAGLVIESESGVPMEGMADGRPPGEGMTGVEGMADGRPPPELWMEGMEGMADGRPPRGQPLHEKAGWSDSPTTTRASELDRRRERRVTNTVLEMAA